MAPMVVTPLGLLQERCLVFCEAKDIAHTLSSLVFSLPLQECGPARWKLADTPLPQVARISAPLPRLHALTHLNASMGRLERDNMCFIFMDGVGTTHDYKAIITTAFRCHQEELV